MTLQEFIIKLQQHRFEYNKRNDALKKAEQEFKDNIGKWKSEGDKTQYDSAKEYIKRLYEEVRNTLREAFSLIESTKRKLKYSSDSLIEKLRNESHISLEEGCVVTYSPKILVGDFFYFRCLLFHDYIDFRRNTYVINFDGTKKTEESFTTIANEFEIDFNASIAFWRSETNRYNHQDYRNFPKKSRDSFSSRMNEIVEFLKDEEKTTAPTERVGSTVKGGAGISGDHADDDDHRVDNRAADDDDDASTSISNAKTGKRNRQGNVKIPTMKSESAVSSSSASSSSSSSSSSSTSTSKPPASLSSFKTTPTATTTTGTTTSGSPSPSEMSLSSLLSSSSSSFFAGGSSRTTALPSPKTPSSSSPSVLVGSVPFQNKSGGADNTLESADSSVVRTASVVGIEFVKQSRDVVRLYNAFAALHPDVDTASIRDLGLTMSQAELRNQADAHVSMADFFRRSSAALTIHSGDCDAGEVAPQTTTPQPQLR